jgi:hypothetical protein
MRIIRRAAGAIAACAFLSSANVATIEYDVQRASGTTWRYDYTVTSDTLSGALEEFTVSFDRALDANLSVAGSPVNWDSLVAQPDMNLPDQGFSGLQVASTLVRRSPASPSSLTGSD